jgi:Ca2+/Na+ antiporter
MLGGLNLKAHIRKEVQMKKLSSISKNGHFLVFIGILCIQALLEKVLNLKVEKIFLAIYLLYFIIYLYYVFNLQEEALSKLKEKVNEQHIEILKLKEIFSNSSYRLDITIEPNWNEIINKIAVQDINSINKKIDDIKHDIEFNIEDDKSLYEKSFIFKYFYDGISKMEQIWSEYDHAFVDDIEIEGNILFTFNKIGIFNNDKFKNDIIVKGLLLDHYLICPSYIGIEDDGFMLDQNILSTIPYSGIIKFLIELDNYCDSMNKIKIFPEKLSIEMEKNGVEYDVLEKFNPFAIDKNEVLIDLDSDWKNKNKIQICDEIIDRHIFKTKYYNLFLKIEIFSSGKGKLVI